LSFGVTEERGHELSQTKQRGVGMSEKSEKAINHLGAEIRRFQAEVVKEKEAHALTTQRLGEAHQRNNELVAEVERLKKERGTTDGWLDDTLKRGDENIIKKQDLQSLLDKANKRVEEYERFAQSVLDNHFCEPNDEQIRCGVCEALRALEVKE
jgi:uncharacterized small protein (DUF1192 family)